MLKKAILGALMTVASLSMGGCANWTVIQPGHRGILFDPHAQGLHPEVLRPGYHPLRSCSFSSVCPRVEDFDVTYSTRKEDIHTISSEGLSLDLHLAVIFRPIEKELYELDTEIGVNYYDEVVGPEFRSAARGVLAHHSYLELQRNNEKIEDEIENDLRRRIKGKHVEVASITLEHVDYAPQIGEAVKAKLVAEQEAIRQKSALEAEALRKKMEIETTAEQARIRAELTIKAKKDERLIAEEQAEIDKKKAEAEAAVRVTRAEAESKERMLLAKAAAEEAKSEYSHLTPLVVQMHAYDALSKLGGTGTTIYMGDFSRVPQFLFPGYSFPNTAAPVGTKTAAK